MLDCPAQKYTSPACTPVATTGGPVAPATAIVMFAGFFHRVLASSFTFQCPELASDVTAYSPASPRTLTLSPAGSAIPAKKAAGPFSSDVCSTIPSPNHAGSRTVAAAGGGASNINAATRRGYDGCRRQ